MCPGCGSDNVSVVEYDFGRCSETGYHDAGERFTCRGCGADGDLDELVIDENLRPSERSQLRSEVVAEDTFSGCIAKQRN